MGKNLAIRGHATRGKEVIKLLEMLGGKNIHRHDGGANAYSYYLFDHAILSDRLSISEDDDFEIFTLQDFLEKYPFKVGDKVFLYDNITEGCVTGMKWDEDKGTVKYCVYTSAECWCDVKELLKWNNVDLVKRHFMDNMEEKDKAKAPDIKGEDYSGKRFGYKIPDGYEFDVVVDGKIILKPIKPKYPKTYKECCDVLLIPPYYNLRYHTYQHGYYEYATSNCLLSLQDKLNTLGKLLICRNAYWKLAGEEMGLGKPWNPDWLSGRKEEKYCIVTQNNEIWHNFSEYGGNEILAFPTEEMRDVFYENFKELIESCKELL